MLIKPQSTESKEISGTYGHMTGIFSSELGQHKQDAITGSWHGVQPIGHDIAVIRAFPCSACNDKGSCSVCRTL